MKFKIKKNMFFVLDKNNKAVSREITTSGEFPDLYVVKIRTYSSG